MPPVPPPDPRPYVSAKRAAAAAETRARLIEAAQRLLEDGPAQMSMEAVAKTAGVTRLTVYKQFGSRRGLLEAVFDDNARRFGMIRMAEAVGQADVRLGLRKAIECLCEFWGSHPSFARLHDAAASDPEFAEALALRNERRRWVINSLLARLPGADRARQDASDLLFGMTSMAMFRQLSATRKPAEVAALLSTAVMAVLDAQGLG